MDHVVKRIRRWERGERRINVGLALLFPVCFAIGCKVGGAGFYAYRVLLTLFFLAFGCFVFLIFAKIVVHYFILDPLIVGKLNDKWDNLDTDFDYEKYEDWI